MHLIETPFNVYVMDFCDSLWRSYVFERSLSKIPKSPLLLSRYLTWVTVRYESACACVCVFHLFDSVYLPFANTRSISYSFFLRSG